jgi:leucyl aminopeptidase
MTDISKIAFAKPGKAPKGTLIAVAGEGLKFGRLARELGLGALIERAAKVADFSGKSMRTLDILAPGGSEFDRLVVIGIGNVEEIKEQDWLRLGGVVAGVLARGSAGSVLLERPDEESLDPAAAADFALGASLRSYSFDKYNPTRGGNGPKKAPPEITIILEDPAKARAAWARAEAIAEGVVMTRDLIHEPPNLLGPVEFAKEAASLKSLGVDVEIFDEKKLAKLGMRALLGVAQGSSRPARLVVMQWKGGKAKDSPLAFIGKGVVFDTGGISIKPAGNMEDMKGDMAGAAVVTGLMRTLAARKAKVNAVGVIGLVENMVDGNAQRPGDIVTALSGRTIEIVNTDAEGRLVLADAIHYTEDRFKPKFIIDLATLTGAIVVALGHQQAGLFATDDGLAEKLRVAGEATGELVWRMPLSTDYDKIIDSRFADVKNSGGRWAGSITAAQFLKRFVKEAPWAHLDIAGVALESPQNEINRNWSSGWGVRLLDRLVADGYER